MKKVLIFLVLIFLCLSKGNCEVYYISQSGKDTNNGLSPESPIKTIKKIREGNTYLFKRGDTIYLKLMKLYKNEVKKNARDLEIKIGAYGNGSRPVISFFRKIKKGKWHNEGYNIWALNVSDNTNFTGYSSKSANVGFLKIFGKICGARKMRKTMLKEEGDFFCDNSHLFLYSKNNINEIADIQVSSPGTILELSDNMEVKDIVITGTGGHGIQGNNVENVTISNVEVKEIGGAYMGAKSMDGTRYGNGIEFINGSKNCIVQNCTVEDVYDSGITLQALKGNYIFQNIKILDNVIRCCEQSFEYWCMGENAGYKECVFSNNKCYDAGFGWSHNVRPDKNVGVHLLNYFNVYKYKDLTVERNYFYLAKSAYLFSNGDLTDIGCSSKDNDVVLHEGVSFFKGKKNLVKTYNDLINNSKEMVVERKSRLSFIKQ